MDIGQVLNGVYDDDLGWRPASGNVKPVHVANGLVRALQGTAYDLTNLNKFVVWWKAGKKSADEKRSLEALAKDIGAPLGFLAESPQDFEKTRRYALGLLGGDRALFPTPDKSSFSLTCGRMATRDHNDRGLGDFAAFLVTGGVEGGSLAEEVVRCVGGEAPSDPVSALVWPLLPSEGKPAKVHEKLAKAAKQRHNKNIFRVIKEAAACLATHERGQGNRLHTIERAVHFACVATHAHAQALAGGGDLDERPPALVALAARRSDVSISSERALQNIYVAFERWLGDRLGKRIADGLPLTADEEPIDGSSTDGRKVRALLGRIGVAEKIAGEHPPPEKEDVDTRFQIFSAVLKELGDEDPARVLGRTLVQCYSREYTGGPRSFLQSLGCKVGLLYPHFQGRAREKRFRPSVPILDMLVRACVEAGTAIEMDVFLERLWTRFGIMLGGRRSEGWDDAAYLEHWNIPVEIEDLAANTDAFVDDLVLMGLARRYPDGVTFVGDGYGG